MKKLKKWSKICVAALILSVTAPSVLPVQNYAVVEAAAVKISHKKLTLTTGKTKTLKITGTKSKVKWSTNKKSVATVSKTGKVTAKKAGTAIITAKVNKKKYTCKVTVKKAKKVNPLVKNAPFKAKVASHKKITYVMPKDFTVQTINEQEKVAMLMLAPSDRDEEKGYSSVVLSIQENGTKQPDYSVTKEYLESYITEDLIMSQYKQQGLEAVISDFKTSDYESKLGTAFKTEYKTTVGEKTLEQSIYDIFVDNYFFEITVSNAGDDVSPDVDTVAQYLLDTIKVSK